MFTEPGQEEYTQRTNPDNWLMYRTYKDTGATYMPVSSIIQDTNNDGKITRADANKVALDNFDRFDLNKDGEIDRDEEQSIAIVSRDETTGKATSVDMVYTEDQIEKGNVPTEHKDGLQETQTANENNRFYTGRSDFAALGDLLANYKSRQAISNALFGDAFLNEWRESVDQFFAENYLGIDYWTSEICKDEFDVVGDSVVGIETAEGIFQFLGSIQGERSEQVPLLCNATGGCQVGSCRTADNVCVDQNNEIIQQFFYKITYSVVAPSDIKLTPYYDEEGAISFNIIISGPDKTAALFTGFIELDNGASDRNVVVKYSPFTYDRVCIVFDKKAVDRKGDDVDEVCNVITISQKSFQNFVNNPGAAQPGAGPPQFNPNW